MTSIADFKLMLDAHDWCYTYSEDPDIYKDGFRNYISLIKISKQSKEHRRLFNLYKRQKIINYA